MTPCKALVVCPKLLVRKSVDLEIEQAALPSPGQSHDHTTTGPLYSNLHWFATNYLVKQHVYAEGGKFDGADIILFSHFISKFDFSQLSFHFISSGWEEPDHNHELLDQPGWWKTEKSTSKYFNIHALNRYNYIATWHLTWNSTETNTCLCFYFESKILNSSYACHRQ